MGIFIMVTHWNGHWDRLKDGKTFYTKSVVKREVEKVLKSNINTIESITTYFIKINEENKQIEHIYEGNIGDVKEEGNKISFQVKLKRKIEMNELPISYYNLPKSPGWYYIQKEDNNEDLLFPPFFNKLKETIDSNEFEDLIYLLLKLIGINDIYKYDRKRQAGLPDGIFKIKNLVVIYDATLQEDIKNKDEQIKNYINRLKSDRVELPGNIFWDIKNFSKRVWIITKNQNKEIAIQDNIKAKAISISDLFEIYKERLKNINDEEVLKKKLEDL